MAASPVPKAGYVFYGGLMSVLRYVVRFLWGSKPDVCVHVCCCLFFYWWLMYVFMYVAVCFLWGVDVCCLCSGMLCVVFMGV